MRLAGRADGVDIDRSAGAAQLAHGPGLGEVLGEAGYVRDASADSWHRSKSRSVLRPSRETMTCFWQRFISRLSMPRSSSRAHWREQVPQRL